MWDFFTVLPSMVSPQGTIPPPLDFLSCILVSTLTLGWKPGGQGENISLQNPTFLLSLQEYSEEVSDLLWWRAHNPGVCLLVPRDSHHCPVFWSFPATSELQWMYTSAHCIQVSFKVFSAHVFPFLTQGCFFSPCSLVLSGIRIAL